MTERLAHGDVRERRERSTPRSFRARHGERSERGAAPARRRRVATRTGQRTLQLLAVAGALTIGGGAALAAQPHGELEGHDQGGHGHPEPAAHGAEHGDAHGGAHHGLEPPPKINWDTMLGRGDKDEHGGTLDEGEEPLAPPMALALFNFVVFATLLLWKAGPPIKRYVAARHTAIKEALEEAARLREEARDKLDRMSDRMAGLDAEIDKMVGEIRSDADAERRRILDEAKKQADAINRSAQEQIDAAIARTRLELERVVIDRAIKAAERMVRQEATAADQEALVSSFISELSPKAPPPGVTERVDEEWS